LCSPAVSLCEVRVSPSNTVSPNLGALELSEALSRVVPFTSKEDTRPVLKCVLFRVADGKLTIVSADGFRLSVVKLDFDGEDGQVLINRDELRGVISALRRAYRVRVSFEKSGESLDGMSLVLDTELIRYKWRGADGNFPDYEKLLPAEFNTFVSFDANEAIKAVSSLKVLSDSKAYPIDLTIGNGKLIMSSPDDKGQTDIPADTLGDGKIRLDGGYLADALRACGGMVDLKLVDGKSPMLFTSPDYELVVMPMLTNESQKPNPIILCRDKERIELTPILPESLKLLSLMTPSDVRDDEVIIRSRRVRDGVRQPMGYKAHTDLIYGLYQRAGVPGSFVPYDLRDTFATMVNKYSRDWFLTERLMHHILPGEGTRYARYPMEQLCKDLQEFSPLRRLQPVPTVPPVLMTVAQEGLASSGEGGTRTPTHCCTGS
jgi:hypothetical protein